MQSTINATVHSPKFTKLYSLILTYIKQDYICFYGKNCKYLWSCSMSRAHPLWVDKVIEMLVEKYRKKGWEVCLHNLTSKCTKEGCSNHHISFKEVMRELPNLGLDLFKSLLVDRRDVEAKVTGQWLQRAIIGVNGKVKDQSGSN